MKISNILALSLAVSSTAAKRARRRAVTTTSAPHTVSTTTRSVPSTTTTKSSTTTSTGLSSTSQTSTSVDGGSSTSIVVIGTSSSLSESSLATTTSGSSSSGVAQASTTELLSSTTVGSTSESSVTSALTSTTTSSASSTSSTQTTTTTSATSADGPSTSLPSESSTLIASSQSASSTESTTSDSTIYTSADSTTSDSTIASSTDSATSGSTTATDSSSATLTTSLDIPSTSTSAFESSTTDTSSASFDTAAYTYYEVELPTTIATVASVTTPTTDYQYVPTGTPACAIDTSKLTGAFKIVDGSRNQIIPKQSGFGILQQSDFPSVSTEDEAASAYPAFIAGLPSFQLEQPAGGPSGFYDVVTTYNSQKRYLAMNTVNQAVASATSSTNGQNPDANSDVTTIFTFSCEGVMKIMYNGAEYFWQTNTDGTVTFAAGEATSATQMLLVSSAPPAAPSSDTQQQRRSARRGASRNATVLVERDFPATDVFLARCPNTPSGLVARPNGKRDMSANGCGTGITASIVPQFGFGTCCNNHDYCYDNCQGGQVEKCNNGYCAPGYWSGCNSAFYSCMHNDVCGGISWFWHPINRASCEVEALFYAAVVSGPIGAYAYVSSSDRCQCQTKSGQPLCNGQIVNLQGNDDNNCGGCNWQCATGYSYHCQSGTCRCTADVQSDNNNCGACGNRCPYKTHCNGGRCVCDQDQCGNTCLDKMSNPNNCGTCGHKCSSGYCWNGQCYTPPTPTGNEPPKCYPTDVVKNGGFDTLDSSGNPTPWTLNVQNQNQRIQMSAGPSTSAASSPNDLQVTSQYAFDADPTLSQPLTMCPGTSYEMTFSAMIADQDPIILQILLGGMHNSQVVTSRTMTSYGPFPFTIPAAPVGGGTDSSSHSDPNTIGYDATGTFAYSAVQFTLWDPFNGQLNFQMDDISIYPA